MSRVVVDPLYLAVPQHLPTAGHPADHRLLILPPAVLVGQVRLDIAELPGTDVANLLNKQKLSTVIVIYFLYSLPS